DRLATDLRYVKEFIKGEMNVAGEHLLSLYIKHKVADCTDNRHIFFVKFHEFWRHIFIFVLKKRFRAFS
ncbi:MAG: hypothetical protein O7C68_03500, partial [Rickettsia endosymbiont of Ixodes ricinus]|nr:hypothetical protein [Rickettsia endosymbiont of Ixodes ricinus]